MSVEERVANLEQAFLALNHLAKRADERHETVGESIRLLTEMIQHHDARLGEIVAEQSNADSRIAALADAQIKTEDALRELSVAQSNASEKIAALAAAQTKTEDQLSRLETVIERLAQETDARLNRLADMIEGRNGSG